MITYLKPGTVKRPFLESLMLIWVRHQECQVTPIEFLLFRDNVALSISLHIILCHCILLLLFLGKIEKCCYSCLRITSYLLCDSMMCYLQAMICHIRSLSFCSISCKKERAKSASSTIDWIRDTSSIENPCINTVKCIFRSYRHIFCSTSSIQGIEYKLILLNILFEESTELREKCLSWGW